MQINRSNYELYFIDYLEGNLRREEKEELLGFLFHNPDLKDEFNEFEKNYSPVRVTEYKFKSNLKKQISDLGPVGNNNIDEYCIAYLENDLNEHGKATLLDEVNKNANFEKIYGSPGIVRLLLLL